VGEVGGPAKDEFLGQALALLFPIDWPEPFGLVMIEAMACGTPVIAYRNGSVPEVMNDGVTGFVVSNQDEAIRAVSRVPSLSRRKCRRVFEERFSVQRMTQDYLAVYEDMLQRRPGRRIRSEPHLIPLADKARLERPMHHNSACSVKGRVGTDELRLSAAEE
jgi:hypothetical protein